MKSIVNREARSKYEFLDSWDAGLILSGAEVKAAKQGKINLKGAYVTIENNECWLKNAHISAYQQINQPGYDPEQPRKLLLKRSEIDTILGKTKEKGLTIVPEKVYSKSGLLKVKVSLARGLKKHDKRERIKKRDLDRQAARTLRQEI
ncbi:MAG: SsrA-binding protein SmpB [Candidatus Kerfeldbacteria bacterium]